MAIKCKVSDSGCVLFECPGCGCLHAVAVKEPNIMNARWTWNDSLERPTFRPSILVKANYTSVHRMDDICHSFVTDGKIQFLGDCTHDMAGQTIELPEWECEHGWETVDHSFDHEYGCEQDVRQVCRDCCAEREYEPPQFEDDVI